MEYDNNRVVVMSDRDGTILEHVDNLYRLDDLRILSGVSEAISWLNRLHIPVIVVTNQPVVGKGYTNEEGVQKIHRGLQKLLSAAGAFIDAFYFCPHHPEAILKEYRVICECRKPEPGLLKAAMKDFKFNPHRSYMVGDTFRDIEAGRRLGCRTIAVTCGLSEFRGSMPDYQVANFYAAAQLILEILEREGLYESRHTVSRAGN